MAFAYLIGISMGLFQKKDKLVAEEAHSSNIINYEVLTPDVDKADNASYTDFIQQPSYADEMMANFDEFIITHNLFNAYSPPIEESIHYNCIITSNLFNRPPPIVCWIRNILFT